MNRKLAIYPEVRGGFIVARDKDVMAGFTGFDEAHAHAVAILTGRAEFRKDLDISAIKIDRKGTRAVLSRMDDRIKERRYITEKDGSIKIEDEKHPILKTS